MALKQKDRFLTIDTILENPVGDKGDDNFLLLQATGAEGLSMPYAFNIVMIGPKDKDPDPAKLIGSRARIGFKEITSASDPDVFQYRHRFGIFEQFARIGNFESHRMYQARLVPAFKLTTYEIRYRVFENMTVEEIIRDVLLPYPEIELNTNRLSGEPFEKIPYCVQFGETTFNFVNRLLDRFGLHYRFEHELNDKREVMVLGGRADHPDLGLGVFDRIDGNANTKEVGNFRRFANIATRHTTAGNFNEINPATPFRGNAEIAKNYAMGGGHPAHEAESFPTPATIGKQPTDYAEARMRQNEGGVFSVTGQTANVGFRPGRTFVIDKNSTDKKEVGEVYLVKTTTFFANDPSQVVGLPVRIWRLATGLIGIGSDSNKDVASAAAQNMLDKIKSDVEKGKEVAAWLGNKPDAGNPSALPDFIASNIGRIGSAIAGAVPAIVATLPAIKDLIETLSAAGDSFSCAFEALPFDGDHLRDLWPSPDAIRPVAHGPHLALVIGPDGIDAGQRDIFCDALGRVRLRFPWDPGPSRPGDPLGEDPVMSGRNTCWARVSDAWAGERFGAQFLPRIGQEVVVGFVDGDPDRPMVIGRTYNARGGQSNLPFLPAAAAATAIAQPADLNGTETDQATRSGIRTRSTPRKPEGQSGFHMIRMEDKNGEEQFLLRSERRMDVTAFGSYYENTRGNRHTVVGGKHEEGKPPIGGSMFTTVGGEKDLHIGKDLYENVDGETNLTTKGNVVSDIGAGWFTYVNKAAAVSADEIILQAKRKITLRVGASSIVITPAAIWLDAAMINNRQGGSPTTMADAEMTDAADAGAADPGEPPDWLARQPKGKGGARRKHNASAKETAFVRLTDDGRLRVGTSFDTSPDASKLLIDAQDPHDADKAVEDILNQADRPGGLGPLNKAMEGPNETVVKPGPRPDGSGGVSTTAGNVPDSVPEGQPTGRTDKDGKQEMGTGKGTGSTIEYDPNAWPRAGDPNSPTSGDVLGQGLSNAGENNTGTAPANTYNGQPATSPPPAPAPAPAPAPSPAPAPAPPSESGS